MTPGFTQKFIRTIVAAAMVATLSGTFVHAGEGGGGEDDILVNDKGKGKAKANANKRGGKIKSGRKIAGPKKWEVRDRRGKLIYKIERSRITKRYYVSKYGKDARSGKNKPKATKSLSQKQMEKASSFDGGTGKTTVRIRLDGKVRTFSVNGDVTGA